MSIKLTERKPDPQLWAFYGDGGVGKTRLVGQAPAVFGKTLYINALGGPESIMDRETMNESGLLIEAELENFQDVQRALTVTYLDEGGYNAVVLDKYGALVHHNVLSKLPGASDTRAVYGTNLADGLRGLAHLQTLRRPVFLVLGEEYDKDEIGAMWWFPELPGQFKSKLVEYVSLLARLTVREDSKTGKRMRVVQLQRAGNNVVARVREPSGKIPAFYEAEDLNLRDVLKAAGVKV